MMSTLMPSPPSSPSAHEPQTPPFLQAASQLAKEECDSSPHSPAHLTIDSNIDHPDLYSPVSRIRGLPPGDRIVSVRIKSEADFLDEFARRRRSQRSSMREQVTTQTSTSASAASNTATSLTSTSPSLPTSPPQPSGAQTKFRPIQVALDLDKPTIIKHHLKECGLSESMIDQLRPVIGRDQMASIWDWYDASKCQTLNASEALQVANWLYRRIPILFREMLRKVHPTKSAQELTDLANSHLTYIMPGTADDIVR